MAKVIIKESAVLSSILKWCWANSVFAWRNNSGAFKTEQGHYVRYGLVGSSDVLAVQPNTGRIICIEAKSSNGKQSPQQADFERKVKQCGGIYILARSIDDLEVNRSLIMGV